MFVVVCTAGKHTRTKDKEEREDERRKRPWREDSKSRQDYEHDKRRRDEARAHSRRERSLTHAHTGGVKRLVSCLHSWS